MATVTPKVSILSSSVFALLCAECGTLCGGCMTGGADESSFNECPVPHHFITMVKSTIIYQKFKFGQEVVDGRL